jgi:hypothetical protein
MAEHKQLRVADIMNQHQGEVRRYMVRDLDMFRIFTVLEVISGTTYVETSVVDEDGTETIEVLFSTDRKHFVLISRSRNGGEHHPMKSYDRDSRLPIYTRVSL